MTTTKKQTAGNNALLAYVKAVYNRPTFARVSDWVNGGDTEHAISFLVGYVREELRLDEGELLREVAAGTVAAAKAKAARRFGRTE